MMHKNIGESVDRVLTLAAGDRSIMLFIALTGARDVHGPKNMKVCGGPLFLKLEPRGTSTFNGPGVVCSVKNAFSSLAETFILL